MTPQLSFFFRLAALLTATVITLAATAAAIGTQGWTA